MSSSWDFSQRRRHFFYIRFIKSKSYKKRLEYNEIYIDIAGGLDLWRIPRDPYQKFRFKPLYLQSSRNWDNFKSQKGSLVVINGRISSTVSGLRHFWFFSVRRNFSFKIVFYCYHSRNKRLLWDDGDILSFVLCFLDSQCFSW